MSVNDDPNGSEAAALRQEILRLQSEVERLRTLRGSATDLEQLAQSIGVDGKVERISQRHELERQLFDRLPEGVRKRIQTEKRRAS